MIQQAHGSRGFIKIIVLVAFLVAALWVVGFNPRTITDSAARTRWLNTQQAHAEYVWNGFLVWYDEQSKATAVMRYLQGKVDSMVAKFGSRSPRELERALTETRD